MKNQKLKDNCNGCYCEDNDCDIIDKLTDFDICPCGICIIKVMCNDACEDYNTFYQHLKQRMGG